MPNRKGNNMKKLIAATAVALLSSVALADTYVNPYVRSDGTFVQGHMRSDANDSKYDNYSSSGNTNPYTGERGYRDPAPTYNQPAIRAPQPYNPPNPYSNSGRGRGGW